MISQKHFSTKNGFILFDAVLGIVLAVFFTSVITASSFQSRGIYENAKNRAMLSAVLESSRSDFENLLPHETKSKTYGIGSSSVQILAATNWYGNDRIETVIDVSNEAGGLKFSAVRRHPGIRSISTPLCAADFKYSGGSLPIITPITLPVGALLPLTDIEVRNGTAFVSADSANAADPDFMIFDMKNVARPVLMSAVNTGPGLVAIALAGEHVFGAAASTAHQLHVIRMQGHGAISLLKKYKLPLPQASTSPPIGSAIFYDEAKVYLGTEKWDGEEFTIIDVSNPEAPVKISSLETGSKINDIYALDGHVYIAASDENQLRKVRFSGGALGISSGFSPSGWQRQEGRTVSIFEDAVMFGRTSGGFNIVADPELFSFRSTSSVSELVADVPGGVYGIVADRGHVYGVTRALNREFSIWDRATATSSASYSLPVQPQAITCDGDRLYILAKTAPVIYEIRFHSN